MILDIYYMYTVYCMLLKSNTRWNLFEKRGSLQLSKAEALFPQ